MMNREQLNKLLEHLDSEQEIAEDAGVTWATPKEIVDIKTEIRRYYNE